MAIFKTYITEIRAIDPVTGELCRYAGPRIVAMNFNDAVRLTRKYGLGYCKILGELIGDVPYDEHSTATFYKDPEDED